MMEIMIYIIFTKISFYYIKENTTDLNGKKGGENLVSSGDVLRREMLLLKWCIQVNSVDFHHFS